MIPHTIRTVALGVLLAGCGGSVPSSMPGAAWPGIGEEALLAFSAGRDLFHRAFTPETGLGPTFNETRCSSCHDVPTLGGAGVERVQKGTRFENGRCDLLHHEGGEVFQQSTTPLLEAKGVVAEPISRRATALVQIVPPQLYALGALAAIADKEILSRADPEDLDEDGISGRAGVTVDGRLARFGRKATVATIREFAEIAFLREMGLTTRKFPQEDNVGGQPPPAGTDPAQDPEIDDATVDQIVRFIELLAFPVPAAPPAARDSIARGKRAFQRIGCSDCHTPTMRTQANPIGAISRKKLPLYSDLLLHDMGPGLATICAPAAEPSEWRTTPLYGLRLRMQYMHDGRVQTIESAIRLHAGEAESSRALFETLSPGEQANLLRFLLSL
ncbi:MAG: di-heme oxidoredictase family protein [Longimicrobiales bacterium]